MDNNICHFISYHKDYHSIHTINFVLETKHQPYNIPVSQAMYKAHYVRSGKGKLHTPGEIYSLQEGDVFFTFPTMPFRIESVEDFSYMYISFLGTRANMIMDKLKISTRNFFFSGCHEIYDFWEKGLYSHPETTDWIAESILLYTFHYLGNKIISLISQTASNEELSLKIKKYIDDNLSLTNLSLEKLSTELAYSPKYISSIFKKTFNIGINEYLNTARIQHACTLMQQGFTSISDISNRCGFSDSLYFSKVFKKKIGISPKNYIKTELK